jgi:hypothetical protein
MEKNLQLSIRYEGGMDVDRGRRHGNAPICQGIWEKNVKVEK